MDIVTSFTLRGIVYSKHLKENGTNETAGAQSGSNMTTEAHASVAIFVTLGLVYFLFTLLYYVVCMCICLKSGWKCSKIWSVHGRGLFIAIGGLCYYIGDNLPPLIREHGGRLDCGEECVEGVQIFGIVMLGIATITYLPVLIDVLPQKRGKDKHVETNTEEQIPLLEGGEQTAPEKKTEEEKTPAHVVVFLLLAKTTNLNLVYTAIERVVPNQCNGRITGGVWAYYTVYFFSFLGLSWYKMWKYNGSEEHENQMGEHNGSEENDEENQPGEHNGSEEHDRENQLGEHNGTEEHDRENQLGEHNGTEEHDAENQQEEHSMGINKRNAKAQRICSKWILPAVIAILLTSFTASYILADNRLPLACSGAAEADLVQDRIRLVLWGVNVLLGILVLVCWYVWKRKVCSK